MPPPRCVALLFVAACSGPAAIAVPAPIAAAAAPDAAAAVVAGPPDAAVRRDEREIGFVSALAAYRSGGRSAYHDLSEAEEQQIADCFDRTMPLEQRQPVVYYVHVFVPNPGRDAEQSGGFGFGSSGADSGLMYPERGTYPDFEACVIEGIPAYRAPADVAQVELRMHVHTVAQSMGTLGHGSAP